MNNYTQQVTDLSILIIEKYGNTVYKTNDIRAIVKLSLEGVRIYDKGAILSHKEVEDIVSTIENELN